MSRLGSPSSSNPRTIVCIDDDPQNRALIRSVFEAGGFLIVAADDGLSGIEAALNVIPALILVDLELPDVDGYAVTAILRTFPKLAMTPIVALTAQALDGDRERALVAGCDGYIAKPVDVDRLPDQVTEFLQGKRDRVTGKEEEYFLRELNQRFVCRLLRQLEDTKRLHQLVLDRARHLETLYEASDDIDLSLGTPELVRQLLRRIGRAIGAKSLSVDLRWGGGQGITVAVDETTQFEGERPEIGSRNAEGMDLEWKHVLSVRGEPIGFILARFVRAHAATMPDEHLLSLTANHLALAIEISRSYESERAAHREAERLYQEAQEIDRRKDDFLAMLSHELRAPLAPIMAAIGLIRQHESASAVREPAEIVERQIRHQARLLDDLLDLSRVRRDKIELRKNRIAVATVLQSALDIARPGLEARHQILSVSLPEKPLFVMADATRLEQVFTNLLSNAVKFTPAGGAITVTVREDAQHVVVRIRDTGEGIAPEAMHRIFELYEQAPLKRRDTREGLGIGLALVRRLVELHEGIVTASSEGRGRGAEFLVALPSASAEGVQAALTAMRAEVKPTRRHILVIEDDPDTRRVLGMTLELDGHRVNTVDTGLAGVSMAVDLRPDVVLLDLGLPDVDGYEVAARIREALGPDVLLVALTGRGFPQDVQRAREVGCDLHLLKPVAAEDLVRALAHRTISRER